MRALILCVLILAGCAQTRGYDDVTTIEQMYLREAENRSISTGGHFHTAPPSVKACVVRGVMAISPQSVLDAANRYLADKTTENWDNYLRVSDAEIARDPSFNSKIKAKIEACKAAY